MIKAIFRAIIWAIKSLFKLIFKIINKLKLWLLLAYLLACGIIQLITGLFSKEGFMLVFWAGLVITVLITLFIILVCASNAHSKKVKAAAPDVKQGKRKKEKESYPKFYTVEGNNDFFMAEYKDRFELYHMDGDGKLTFVRTDKKEKEENK